MKLVVEKVTLAQARKLADMTQNDLAERLSVSPGTIINWEKGKTEPSVSQAIAISEAVGIPYDCIIFLHKSTV